MPLAQLIDSTELTTRLSKPNLCIFDCRFALDDPDYGRRGYEQAHIPGARFLDLEKDLSGSVIRGQTGRHPLPQPEQLIARLRAAGLNNDSEVVLYDDGPGAFAARAWWLLAWLGKRSGVYMLDGGLKAWRDAGGLVTAESANVPPGQFDGTPDDDLLISAQQLTERLEQPGLTLIDARALPRFLGEQEPIDPVAGHIPGARCVPFSENLDATGHFLPSDQLRSRFDRLLTDQPADTLVAYCGSGVTACHNLFSLCLAGYPLAKLYAGSWSEWINDPARPLA
ncbi:sulfurtransferase [Stutzerimonas xanthomarina]|uniref:Sulfurtransferase n=2 Tax=Stutzerimonas xanthomarina TaxID=271420 RepID=A0A1M5RPU6_9GAMM|nr:sulfurtransferase [Stutzerimonas xanthomarina]MCP9339247.1 sulfurtransferase [Stutzerimonas xanthomarina]SEH94933.1 thiosulfate/3-mercaptopyruvate sulfurtransferase [Stutzerimonas xanthomarina]SHH28335.1 thiosulfate/3-mercaptopyruvate sulfurtransferase [Stutzerimonas xanthomarina DSM 18231]